jgi:hypothetical protein
MRHSGTVLTSEVALEIADEIALDMVDSDAATAERIFAALMVRQGEQIDRHVANDRANGLATWLDDSEARR